MALRHAPLGVVRWKAGPQDPWPSCTASLDASFCGLRARIAPAAARMASVTMPDQHLMISRRQHARPARPGHRAAMALPALAASMRVRGQSRPPWPSAFVACWSPLVKSGCENSRGGPVTALIAIASAIFATVFFCIHILPRHHCHSLLESRESACHETLCLVSLGLTVDEIDVSYLIASVCLAMR